MGRSARVGPGRASRGRAPRARPSGLPMSFERAALALRVLSACVLSEGASGCWVLQSIESRDAGAPGAVGPEPEPPCTHFASPDGGGTGSAQNDPFKVSAFWSVARPGSVLCLLDGVYSDEDSNVEP